MMVSTNQLELPPLTVSPRARKVVFVGRTSPVSCQPPACPAGRPGMRMPPPRLVHEAPSGEYSKVVRQTSGQVPPRIQVRVEPSKVRLWVAGPVLLSRPMLVRLCPPSVVNWPATRIFPSACTARDSTAPSVPGLKLGSSFPSALSRPMPLRLRPPSALKLPPTRIFPSACTAREYTVLSASGLKLVSSVPSALSRPMLVRLCPPSVVKLPPTRILSSACTARESTIMSNPALNVVSSVPSVLSRPMLGRLCPPKVVNETPTRICPSACTAREYTNGENPPAPGLKLMSSVPSALSRPMPKRLPPPSVVKLPATRIAPSACNAKESTEKLAPALKLVSNVPSALSRSVPE